MSNLEIAAIGLDGSFVRATDTSQYDAAIARGSELAVLHPSYVAYPATFEDVPKLINFSRSHAPPLELAVKSGGMNSSTAASSDGGLVIDLSKLNRVSMEGSDGDLKIRAQAGALTGDVYTEAAKHGLDVLAANVWNVGIGGFLTGGGHSYISGVRGLGIDNILEATVALSDGRIVKTGETVEPDLFWAIRGGTNQFGIVLEFVLKAYPTAGAASVGALVYPGTDFEKFAAALEEALLKIGPQDRLMVAYARVHPHFYPGLLLFPYIGGSPARADGILSPFRTALSPLSDMIQLAPDLLTVSHGSDAFMEHAPRRVHIRGALLPDVAKGLDKGLLGEVWASWIHFTEANEDARESMILWEYAHAGKIADCSEDATAFGRRNTGSYVAVQGRHRSPASDEPSEAWVRDTTTLIRAWHKPDLGTFPNFAHGDEPLEDIYGPGNSARLRKLKAVYDPDCVWPRGIRIDPDFGATGDWKGGRR